jgi:hypothetical protein
MLESMQRLTGQRVFITKCNKSALDINAFTVNAQYFILLVVCTSA